ncbi:uncharacterized protein LOC144573591 [Carex rostrata]
MGASYLNTISYPYRKFANFLSSFSSNNTTTPPPQQQPPSVDVPAGPATLTVLIVPETPKTQLVSATITTSGNTTGDNHAQDNSERIAEQVQSISIATGTGSCTLLANPPEHVYNRRVLYRMYLLFLLLSFMGTAALVYIPKTTPSPGGAWLLKQILRVAILSFIISVILKIFSLLPTPMEWYDVLVPLLLLSASSPYLWYGWIKANNSGQTSSPAITTPVEDIWKSIAKKVQPISIAVGAGSCTLLANPPQYEHNQHVQYRLFLLFLLFSFGSTAALVYIPKTTPSPGDAWLQKQALKTAIVCFIFSVTLRIFLLLTPIEWYDVLIPFVVIAVSSLYLWYGWKKANNLAQASNPEGSTKTKNPAQISSFVASSDNAV